MVLPGQYLERPTLIRRPTPGGPEAALTLEGLFHRGQRAPAIVVCAPHPRLGGSMDSPVVAELAWALTRAGHATLRFNYQGVGASEGALSDDIRVAPGTLSGVEREVDDAAAAVEHLAATVEHGRVALAGYSFGARVALELAQRDKRISHLLLVSPPASMVDLEALKRCDRPLLAVSGQRDALVDRALLGEAVRATTDGSCRWIAGADHVFTQGLTELGHTVVDWFATT